MFETIQKVSRSRDTLVRSAMRQILRNGGQELLWLADFHKSETAIQAVLPNLDGLYGGKPCVRKIDNSKAANITKNISTLLLFQNNWRLEGTMIQTLTQIIIGIRFPRMGNNFGINVKKLLFVIGRSTLIKKGHPKFTSVKDTLGQVYIRNYFVKNWKLFYSLGRMD